MGGDFLSNLKGTALPARKEHGVTFAPEIGQQHTGSLIKNKREAIGILWITAIGSKSSHSGNECIKINP